MTKNERLNEKVAELLNGAGSLNALAKRAGIQPTTLYNLKNRKVEAGNIPVEVFMRLCDALGVSPLDLYYDERPPSIEHYYMQLPDEERGFVDDALAIARHRAALKEAGNNRVEAVV